MSYTTFEFEINDDLFARLEKLAEEEGVTTDELVEDIILNYINTSPVDEDDAEEEIDIDENDNDEDF